MSTFEVRATFTVTLDVEIEAETPEKAETIAADYIGNECNFTVERFDDFLCKEIQFDEIVVEDVNEKV